MNKLYGMLAAGVVIIIGVSAFALYNLKAPENAPPIREGSGQRQASDATTTMRISSDAFSEGSSIPLPYTCDGAGVSPEIAIDGVPADALSLVLIVTDPDIPQTVRDALPESAGGAYVHWIMFNIPASKTVIRSGETAGLFGMNSAGSAAYTPPCPPSQYEPARHRYIFTLYALDTLLPLSPGATRSDLLHAMGQHILETATLTGTYERH